MIRKLKYFIPLVALVGIIVLHEGFSGRQYGSQQPDKY